MTLIELIVATAVSMTIVGLTIGLTVQTKTLYQFDSARTDLSQDMRGALDILGIAVRESGERLPSTFPAIEITNGAAGAPDTLILRRNLLDNVLVVCQNVSAGSTSLLYLATTGSTVAACTYGAQSSGYTVWANYRIAEGGTVKAYLFNQTTRNGEFFDYTAEANTGTNMTVTRTGGSWQYPYTGGFTSLYIIEEWKFELDTGVLKLTENNDATNIQSITYGLTDFQLTANMQDGTTKTTLLKTDTWSQAESLTIALTGEALVKGYEGTVKQNKISRTLSAKFFPRNILSN